MVDDQLFAKLRYPSGSIVGNHQPCVTPRPKRNLEGEPC